MGIELLSEWSHFQFNIFSSEPNANITRSTSTSMKYIRQITKELENCWDSDIAMSLMCRQWSERRSAIGQWPDIKSEPLMSCLAYINNVLREPKNLRALEERQQKLQNFFRYRNKSYWFHIKPLIEKKWKTFSTFSRLIIWTFVS